MSQLQPVRPLQRIFYAGSNRKRSIEFRQIFNQKDIVEKLYGLFSWRTKEIVKKAKHEQRKANQESKKDIPEVITNS